MVGSRAAKDQRRRVGKNWLMIGFWKTRPSRERVGGLWSMALRPWSVRPGLSITRAQTSNVS